MPVSAQEGRRILIRRREVIRCWQKAKFQFGLSTLILVFLFAGAMVGLNFLERENSPPTWQELRRSLSDSDVSYMARKSMRCTERGWPFVAERICYCLDGEIAQRNSVVRWIANTVCCLLCALSLAVVVEQTVERIRKLKMAPPPSPPPAPNDP